MLSWTRDPFNSTPLITSTTDLYNSLSRLWSCGLEAQGPSWRSCRRTTRATSSASSSSPTPVTGSLSQVSLFYLLQDTNDWQLVTGESGLFTPRHQWLAACHRWARSIYSKTPMTGSLSQVSEVYLFPDRCVVAHHRWARSSFPWHWWPAACHKWARSISFPTPVTGSLSQVSQILFFPDTGVWQLVTTSNCCLADLNAVLTRY